MTRIMRRAWTLLAGATIELVRLFPGVGRVRARVSPREAASPSDLDGTLRRFRRAVTALWLLNALVAVAIVAAVVGVV